MERSFCEAVRLLPPFLKEPLLFAAERNHTQIREVTIRAGVPVCVHTSDGIRFLQKNGFLTTMPPANCSIKMEEVQECLRCLTEYSLQSAQPQLKQGFLTLQGGHRAGIAGRAVLQDGQISYIKEISAISLRIARAVCGCGKRILSEIDWNALNGIPSVLIAGPPASGKTTVLRDVIRGLASGECGRFFRVSVVDERSEIAASYHGTCQHDLGITCDVLDGFFKAEGMMLALRALSPQIIAVDELGSEKDADAVLQVMSGGAAMLATVHADSFSALSKRPVLKRLFAHQCFDFVVLLKSAQTPGVIDAIIRTDEIKPWEGNCR